MRAILQRVSEASVNVEEKVIGKIDRGILLLLGVSTNDAEKDAEYLLKKTLNLRIFNDSEGKMNSSLLDIDGDLLVVSQFTLYGDARKGRRPSYIKAATPRKGEPTLRIFC